MLSRFKRKIFYFLHRLTINLFFKNNGLGLLSGKLIEVLTKKNYQVFKIDYFQNHTSRTNIRDTEESYVLKPKENNKPAEKITKQLAPLGYNIINNGVIEGKSPFVIIDNTLYKQMYYTIRPQNQINFKNKLILQTTSKYAYIDKHNGVKEILKGIFIGGSYPFNWYHWVIEILPKIELIKSIPEKYLNFPILVPEVIKNLKNHRYLLEHIFKGFEVIYLTDNHWFKVDQLIWLDSPVIHAPNFKGATQKLYLKDSNFDWKLMRSYRKRILGKSDIEYDNSKRIFLARKQKERPYNQDEVYKMLKKYGFKAVYFENMSLIEQRDAVKNSSVIVGPTGSAWTNLIFCDENKTQAIIFMPEIVRNANLYANLAELSHTNLIHYYYSSKAKSWYEFMHQKEKVTIDIIELENILLNLLPNSTK